ncbi:MAG TPA: PHP-associated domain-containing protein [Thermoanaerobaculia bacterium]|jgi:predicted metal-dependent phosphoesterase TrpH|nr:PHP-associated domain-containing protein [Thermoanaerobaculia bacterium]
MNDTATVQILADPTIKRADLHCHSRYSVFKYFRRANTRDCYNNPEDVYRIAKERGMSYVTLTDHDSIDGALYLLNKYPDMTDFFIGEEVETFFPETGQRIHVGVWGLNEAQHREIQRLRPNIREMVPYMKSQRMIFGVNHLFQNYRMKNVAAHYIAELLEMFDIFEAMNGAMASFHNKMVQQLVTTVEKGGRHASMIGGSDAHTLKHVAKVHTVSKGETTTEFLENIRSGDCFAWGSEMRFRELIADIYLLTIAYNGQARADLMSQDYSVADKTMQLAGRLASIPAAISGLPAAITSLNYLKQIVVTKGISMRFEKLVEKIQPGLK